MRLVSAASMSSGMLGPVERKPRGRPLRRESAITAPYAGPSCKEQNRGAENLVAFGGAPPFAFLLGHIKHKVGPHIVESGQLGGRLLTLFPRRVGVAGQVDEDNVGPRRVAGADGA